VCDAPGPTADIDVPDTWDDLMTGTLPPGEPMPLWFEGTLGVDDPRDVAAVVDGTFVGWGTSYPQHLSGDGNRFGVLLAAPLLDDVSGPPTFFEVVDVAGCRLRPLER
jgi:hypothetical protein